MIVRVNTNDAVPQFRQTRRRHTADISEPKDGNGSRLLRAAVILSHGFSIANREYATRYNGDS